MTWEEGRPVNPAAPALRFAPEAVERLERLLDDVITGRVEVWSLPHPLADWYWSGWHDGRDSLRPDLDAANSEADRLWALAFADKKPQQLVTELLAHERAVEYRQRHKRGNAA